MLAALAGLPLFACGAAPVLPRPVAFPAPRRRPGGLMLLLLPGLNAADLLVGANDGALPNVAAMAELGLLVEGISPPQGLIYTPDEVWQECVAALPGLLSVDTASPSEGREGSDTAEVTACVSDPSAPAAIATGCGSDDPDPLRGSLSARGSARPGQDGADPQLTVSLAQVTLRLRSLADSGLRQAMPRGGERLLADDGFLALGLTQMLADSRQPGYTVEGVMRSAREWRQALMALDACLGRLLLEIDLSVWALALLSTCEAGPVVEGLAVERPLARWRHILLGGAMLEASAEALWPADGAWAEARVGRAPSGGARRLLAPPGSAFTLAGQPLPRATPRPGGLLLAIGRGAPRGERLASLAPRQLGEELARLAG